MKHLFLSFVMLLSAMTAVAADCKSLVFQKTDGSRASIALTSLDITISGGRLMAATATDSLSLSLSELSKMFFSTEESTGIAAVRTSRAGGQCDVYDLSGRRVGSFGNIGTAKSALRQGVYVVRQGGRSVKLAVQ